MDLVREFARDHSEAAFTELVRRHVNLVYSVALRQAGQAGDAQDIAQAVFILLARKAPALREHTVLTGWLYETTRFTASRWLRTVHRRQAREQEAYMQSLTPDSDPAHVWRQLSPYLELAMAQLGESDRALLVLRYYENKTGPEAAALLGIGAAAAQKRAARALEKLRKFFARRGITLSAAALAGALSAHAVQTAPAGLAASLAAGAFSGTALTTATLLAGTPTLVMTTLQKSLLGAALAVTVSTAGLSLHESRQAAQARATLATWETQKTPLSAQLQQLQRERDDATNRLAALNAQLAQSRRDHDELLRLRGLAGVARRATEEAEHLRAQLAQPAASQPGTNFMLGAMADAMKQAMEQQVKGRLSRMSASLHLTGEQTQAIHDILMRQAELQSTAAQQAMAGNFDQEQLMKQARAGGDPEAQIKALLTPDQLAEYPAYQQDENVHNASLAANTEVTQLQTTLELTQDQLDPVYAALYDLTLNELSGKATPPPSTNMTDALTWSFDQKVKILTPLLTPAQLETYRQQQASMASLVNKMLNPDKAK